MKTNAIVRICIYTVLILFLVGILATVLMGWNPFRGDGYEWKIIDGQLRKAYYPEPTCVEVTWPEPTTPEGETIIDEALVPSDTDERSATVLSPLNIHATPSPQGTVLDALDPGEEILIDETQIVNGTAWGHINFPVPGWITMDYVELHVDTAKDKDDDPGLDHDDDAGLNGTITATALNIRKAPDRSSENVGTYHYGDKVSILETQDIWGRTNKGWIVMEYVALASTEESNAVDKSDTLPIPDIVGGTNVNPDNIQKLSIDWAVGDVIIRRGNTQVINVYEDAPSGAKPMVCEIKDGTKLKIQFHEGKFNVNIGFGDLTTKDLTVTVPMDFDLRELDVDMASGNVEIQGMTIDKVDLDCADVTCILDQCTVNTLDVDAASGDISFSGSLGELDMDSASADFIGVFQNTPRKIDMDGMSGTLDITLPQNTGFTAKVEGLSNNFSSDFPTKSVNGAHTHGNGSCRINVDGMSGDVTIRRGEK